MEYEYVVVSDMDEEIIETLLAQGWEKFKSAFLMTPGRPNPRSNDHPFLHILRRPKDEPMQMTESEFAVIVRLHQELVDRDLCPNARIGDHRDFTDLDKYLEFLPKESLIDEPRMWTKGEITSLMDEVHRRRATRLEKATRPAGVSMGTTKEELVGSLAQTEAGKEKSKSTDLHWQHGYFCQCDQCVE